MSLDNTCFCRTQPRTRRPAKCWIRALRTACLLLCFSVFNVLAPSTLLAAPSDEYWEAGFSLPGFDGNVEHVATDSHGNVYAAGSFTYVDGLEVNRLARWNGTSWAGLGVVLAGEINGIGVDANDILYVLGELQTQSSYSRKVSSWNGATWTDLSPDFSNEFSALAVADDGTLYAGGDQYNVGDDQGVYIFDGVDWSLLGDKFSSPSASIVSIIELALDGNGNLLVGGQFENVGTTPVNSVALWNGTSWSALGTGVTRNINSGLIPGTVTSIAIDGSGNSYFSGSFDFVDGVAVTGTEIVKWANSAWIQPFSGADNLLLSEMSMEFDASGTLYIAGSNYSDNPAASVFSWSGSQWTGVGQPLDVSFYPGVVHSLSFANDGTLYIGGVFAGSNNGNTFNGAARLNGVNWEAFTTHGGQGANHQVNAMVQAGNGDVYVGGDFNSIGGKPIQGFARWDGVDWWPVSDGNTRTRRVDAIDIASNGNVYVGGFFTDTTGRSYSVARWDGSTWSYPGGFSRFFEVSDIQFDNSGILYVASADDYASSGTLVRWDGNAWSDVGGGVTQDSEFGQVAALELTASGDLIVVGKFTQAGSVTALNVAIWDGTSWSAMGAGLNVSLSKIESDIVELPGGEIVVAGGFTSIGSPGTSPLAVWNGSGWNLISGPANNYGQASALSLTAQDKLIVAGEFSVSFEPESSGVAEWDGVQWTGYGSGITGIFGGAPRSVLALQDSSVLLGGRFSETGGKPANNIARWTGPVTPNELLCNGKPVTVVISLGETATSGDDVILGTTADDLITGFGGNDTICALGGDDIIFAGNGDDWVDAGSGDDEVEASNGTDTVFGGAGNDYLAGGPGDDMVDGDTGNDALYGNRGNDTIIGGAGIDDIRGGAGDDTINTGSGGTVGTGSIVDGGAGDDIITGGSDADEIRGSSDQDIIAGGDGDDQLYGGGGEDEVSGEAGDDLMRGNAGDDVLAGGSGNDNINGYGSRDTITGGEGDDTLDGSTGNDVIRGEAGDDTIRGGGGNDQLFGDAGIDNLAGGGGNDSMDGGSGMPDICDGQGGVDTAAVSCENVLNTP